MSQVKIKPSSPFIFCEYWFLILLILSFFLFLTSLCQAQYGSYGLTDARSVGMGGSSNALSWDVFSIGKNPAFLAFPTNKTASLSIILPNGSSQAYSNSLSLDDINFYFGGGKYLTSDERDKLYDAFKDNALAGTALGFNPITISWMPSVSFGTFGFAVNDYVSGSITVPHSFFELALKGNEQGRNYSFDEFRLESWWLRAYSLSYGKIIFESPSGFLKNLSLGLSVKYYSGYAYAGTKEVSSSIFTDSGNTITANVKVRSNTSFSQNFGMKYSFDLINNPQNNLSYFSRPSGSGYGFDFGLAGELNNGLIIGISIIDIGSITWSENAAEFYSHGDIKIDDLFNQQQQKALEDFITTDGRYIGSFKTTLPTNLRFGVAFDLKKFFNSVPGSLWSGIDYNQGLNNFPSNSTVPHCSIGAIWLPGLNLPTASTGLSNDITGHIRWSLGTGFSTKYVDAHISTYDIVSILSKSVKPDLSVAFCLIWKII